MPERKQGTTYKKPKRINVVSVTMFFIAALIAYFIYSVYPVVTLRLRVKSELEDMITRLWRANLLPEAVGRKQIAEMKKELLLKLPKVGVKDKKLEVILERGKKRVAIEARFTTEAFFPVLDYRRPVLLTPRVETDAARVDW